MREVCYVLRIKNKIWAGRKTRVQPTRRGDSNELSELLKIKLEKNELSKSEQLIFHSKRELKKDFFKGLAKKEF